jgi:hypothetical protein
MPTQLPTNLLEKHTFDVDLGQLVDAVTKAVAAVNTGIGAVKTVISIVAD